MRTKRILLGSLLLLLVLFTGYSSAIAEGSASYKMMTGVPAAVQITQLDVPPEPVTPEAATILDSEVSIFSSEITGLDYRIYVALPQGYTEREDTPPKYPVVYMLDANWHFGIVTGITRALANLSGEMGKVIIVGIGYPTDDNNEVMNLRAWDMLPGRGAEAFLEFMEEELIPHIDANYRTTKKVNRTLVGHSYGGLFTLYTLFNATDTFQKYIAMSPALWYGYEYDGQRVVFDYEEAYASVNQKLPVDLFLSVGEFEPEELWNLWMVRNLIEFHQVMEDRAYDKLNMEMVIMEGVNHASSYPGAVTRGLLEVSP